MNENKDRVYTVEVFHEFKGHDLVLATNDRVEAYSKLKEELGGIVLYKLDNSHVILKIWIKGKLHEVEAYDILGRDVKNIRIGALK